MTTAHRHDFQPLDRPTARPVTIAPRMFVPAVAMESVDPTHRARDRRDQIVDAHESLTVQRIACRCFIGAQCCAICAPDDPRFNQHE